MGPRATEMRFRPSERELAILSVTTKFGIIEWPFLLLPLSSSG